MRIPASSFTTSFLMLWAAALWVPLSAGCAGPARRRPPEPAPREPERTVAEAPPRRLTPTETRDESPEEPPSAPCADVRSALHRPDAAVPEGPYVSVVLEELGADQLLLEAQINRHRPQDARIARLGPDGASRWEARIPMTDGVPRVAVGADRIAVLVLYLSEQHLVVLDASDGRALADRVLHDADRTSCIAPADDGWITVSTRIPMSGPDPTEAIVERLSWDGRRRSRHRLSNSSAGECDLLRVDGGYLLAMTRCPRCMSEHMAVYLRRLSPAGRARGRAWRVTSDDMREARRPILGRVGSQIWLAMAQHRRVADGVFVEDLFTVPIESPRARGAESHRATSPTHYGYGFSHDQLYRVTPDDLRVGPPNCDEPPAPRGAVH